MIAKVNELVLLAQLFEQLSADPAGTGVAQSDLDQVMVRLRAAWAHILTDTAKDRVAQQLIQQASPRSRPVVPI